MTASSVAAEPLWKYGARAASPRRTGPLNFPMSAHLPVVIARPGSVVVIVSPVDSRRSVYSGMSAVRRDASVSPIFNGAFTEWLPAFGVSWQVVHVPVNEPGTATPLGKISSLRPATPEIVIGSELKRRSPRTIALLAWSTASRRCGSERLVQASNIVKALGSNGAPVGLRPTGSLMPG